MLNRSINVPLSSHQSCFTAVQPPCTAALKHQPSLLAQHAAAGTPSREVTRSCMPRCNATTDHSPKVVAPAAASTAPGSAEVLPSGAAPLHRLLQEQPSTSAQACHPTHNLRGQHCNHANHPPLWLGAGADAPPHNRHDVTSLHNSHHVLVQGKGWAANKSPQHAAHSSAWRSSGTSHAAHSCCCWQTTCSKGARNSGSHTASCMWPLPPTTCCHTATYTHTHGGGLTSPRCSQPP